MQNLSVSTTRDTILSSEKLTKTTKIVDVKVDNRWISIRLVNDSSFTLKYSFLVQEFGQNSVQTSMLFRNPFHFTQTSQT